MGKFLESEKLHQAKFKASSPYVSNAARADGVYKGKPRPFCLPIEYAEENLFPEIRQAALAYFASQGIKCTTAKTANPVIGSCQLTVHPLPKAETVNNVWRDGFRIVDGLVGGEIAGKIALMHPAEPAYECPNGRT